MLITKTEKLTDKDQRQKKTEQKVMTKAHMAFG
jgi:hypothetical protein